MSSNGTASICWLPAAVSHRATTLQASVRKAGRQWTGQAHTHLPCPCLQLALDYIGKRGSTVGVTQSKRIEYAREILQKEMLPHMGIQPNCQASKVRPMQSAGQHASAC